MESPEPKPRLRPRISLLSLLLLTALVACGIVIAQQAHELEPLRRDNKRLNEERGTLVFKDDQKVQVIRVPDLFTDDPERNQTFRVFIPEGRQYVAVVAVNGIPKEGYPEIERGLPTRMMILGQAGRNAFATLPPGENQLSIGTQKWPSGQLRIRFAARTTSTRIPLSMSVDSPTDQWPHDKWEAFSTFGDEVGGITRAFDPTERIVLKRYRVEPSYVGDRFDVSFSTHEPDGPMDGYMLWLEPVPTPPPPR